MTLPAYIEPRSFLGAGSWSYSELNTLTQCENRWFLQYGPDRAERTPASPAMELGTEIHRLWGHWWLTGELLETAHPTAAWVMQRYADFYGADRSRGRMRMLEVERPFAARYDGSHVFGFIDGLAEVRGMVDEGGDLDGLWVVEKKTSGQISNILHLEMSAQTRIYVLALLQEGLPVKGALIDVSCTSGSDKVETKDAAYKRLRADGVAVKEAKLRSATERLSLEPMPLHESFTRRWLRLDRGLLANTVGQLNAATSTRRALLTEGRTPLRNVGPMTCKTCPVVSECHDLGIEIIDEDTN